MKDCDGKEEMLRLGKEIVEWKEGRREREGVV